MKPRWPVLFLAVLPGSARADAPLQYLSSAGASAHPTTALTWGLLLISILVVLIVTGLVWAGAVRRRDRASPSTSQAPVSRGGDGLRWLSIGVGLTAVALVVSLVWTVTVLAATSSPPHPPTLTIKVVGHQWWWEAVYAPDDPAQRLETANELHIPVGRPVRLELASTDVIHSFWVPQLAGKTDAIPGRVNLAWLQADRPGVFWGQCTEYCGQQHAHMAFKVIAEPERQFQDWWRGQLRNAPPAATPAAALGEEIVENRCGACHTIRGTAAGGSTAPDLTHLMSRTTLAAGVVPNTAATLSGWIANPQAIKPGTLMPTLYLSGPELQAARSYLETLL